MDALLSQLDAIMPTAIVGSVVQTDGAATAVSGFPAPVGAVVQIERHSGPPVTGEVVGFRDELTLVCPLGDMAGVRYGSRVRLASTSRFVRAGQALLGRVVNADGAPLDGRPQPMLRDRVMADQDAPDAYDRPRIDTRFGTGIRAIDGLLPCGRGQRMGIFSGAGVGKSMLLGMMARYTDADVNVIALIGERGREVREFVERNLGPEGLANSVVVVATCDSPPLVRVKAALTATAIAEYFRDQGKHVLLAMDSLTRFATAQREIGLAAGESPAARGYPTSVFAALPKLLERAGCSEHGSITAFYTVLVEGDDLNEPVSDAARSLLDGHIVLSRELASAGHFPAIDVLNSVSRLAHDVAGREQMLAIREIQQLMAAYREHADLISIGAYRAGSNPTVDDAIALRNLIQAFLRQDLHQACTIDAVQADLVNLCQQRRQLKQAA